MASPKASAESFSFIASSIAFLALPVLLFDFGFFFPLFFLVLSAVAPPRSFKCKNGSDGPLFLKAVPDIAVDVVVAVIAVANFVNDEQTTTKDKTVLILHNDDDDDIVGESRGSHLGEDDLDDRNGDVEEDTDDCLIVDVLFCDQNV